MANLTKMISEQQSSFDLQIQDIPVPHTLKKVLEKYTKLDGRLLIPQLQPKKSSQKKKSEKSNPFLNSLYESDVELVGECITSAASSGNQISDLLGSHPRALVEHAFAVSNVWPTETAEGFGKRWMGV